MKKGAVIFCMMFLSFNLMAQTKITKTGIIGNWVLSSIEFKDYISCDLLKDSIIFSDTMKQRSLEMHLNIDSLIDAMKPNLKVLHEIFYRFDIDGTGEIYWGQGPASDYKITYTIDEEKSIIIISDRHQKNQPTKAEMLGNQLSIFIKQTPQDGGMNIHMILHKSK